MRNGYARFLSIGLALLMGACGGGGSTGGGGDVGPGVDVAGDSGRGVDTGGVDSVLGRDTVPGEDTVPGQDTVPGEDTTAPGEAFRIAVISDPTVIEDDYNAENHKIDEIVAAINGEEGIDFVLVLGDLAAVWNDPWHTRGPEATWAGSLELAVQKLDALDVPWYATPGEKDYADLVTVREYDIDFVDDWAQREADLKDALGDAYPGSEPWWVKSHKGVRFVGLNTMAGPLWDANLGTAGSLGGDQLVFLEDQLAAGDPVILLGHHRYNLLFEEGADSLAAVLDSTQEDLLALFNGHLYSYSEYTAGGAPGFGFHAVTQAPDGKAWYAIVEIDPVAGTVEVVNRADLPYPVPAGTLDCTPGEDTVGAVQGFVGSAHAVWFTQIAVEGDPLLAELAQLAEIGETPFAFKVMSDNGNLSWDIMAAEAGNAPIFPDDPGSEDIGEHVLENDFSKMMNPLCVILPMSLEDPCLSGQGEVTYNLIRLIDPEGPYGFCNLEFPFTGDVSFSVRLGPDGGGALTLLEAELDLELDKATAVQALHDFMVDAYCKEICNAWGPFVLMPQDGCSPGENGHSTACGAGTLVFGDIPPQCDMQVGGLYEVPLRMVLTLLENLEGDSATIRLTGWGHSMTVSGDLSQDWTIDPLVLGGFACQEL